MKTIEIQTGWKAHDQALRDLDEAEEARDNEGLPVPGYEDRAPTYDELAEAHGRELHAPRERAAWVEKFEQFRMDAIVNRLIYACRWCIAEPAVKHIWADEQLLKIELRDGNPPSDRDRPKHLQGLDLVVDPARHGPITQEMWQAYQAIKKQAKFNNEGSAMERVKKALSKEFKGE